MFNNIRDTQYTRVESGDDQIYHLQQWVVFNLGFYKK